jgi:acetyl esterase/lipase
VLHLPPVPLQSDSVASPPSFLQGWPVASINYRWGTGNDVFVNENDASTPLQWPTPVHDTSFAYAWLVGNLAPEGNTRRDMLVYGSYLGASLAASLALTETHPHARFGVRGLAAYNGVYNWTMFLTGHPMYRKDLLKIGTEPRPLAFGSHMSAFLDDMEGLFPRPSDAFDPFASPSLFFHRPGMHCPTSFDEATVSPFSTMVSAVVKQEESDKTPAVEMKRPRTSYMVYPPRKSTLKIPPTLLLHDRFDRSAIDRPRKLAWKGSINSIQTQAEELAGLMQRSISKVELGERVKWDDEIDSWEARAQERVQVEELGEERDDLELDEDGQERVKEWLETFS